MILQHEIKKRRKLERELDRSFEQFTTRVSPATGKPYPRCQVALAGIQCEKTAYSDGLCWNHYRMAAPTDITGRPRIASRRPRKQSK